LSPSTSTSPCDDAWAKTIDNDETWIMPVVIEKNVYRRWSVKGAECIGRVRQNPIAAMCVCELPPKKKMILLPVGLFRCRSWLERLM
jgi:hypothetical protein